MPPRAVMHGKQLRKFGESLHYKRLPSVREVAFCTEKHNQNNPFGTKGALLYSPNGSMCVLRSLQPGQLNVRAVLRHFCSVQGSASHALPQQLSQRTLRLMQFANANTTNHKVLNIVHKPATENVGGLFYITTNCWNILLVSLSNIMMNNVRI